MEQYTNWNSSYIYRKIYLNDGTHKEFTNYFSWNETKCITAGHTSSHEQLLPMAQEDVCLIQTKIPPAYDIEVHGIFDINERPLCKLVSKYMDERKPRIFLRTSRLNYFSLVSINVTVRQATQVDRRTVVNSPMFENYWYCNRGIHMLFENNKTTKCLCPPSYFGERCQWENQRISLTIQLIYRTSTFGMSVFQVIIMLIDEQRQITSYHEQITYVPKRDCKTKFNIYLLYPDQPKNSSANYSIHIDIFDKIGTRTIRCRTIRRNDIIQLQLTIFS
ncbi:unnamed protein product [Rotaria sp. Silwood2]|nr:unnamed protein product [Rotaria sp. Silwood2]CAF4630780.1 unnamed protein product [Rotaria sp. Silwood2]